MPTSTHPDTADACRYEIRVEGHLDDRWSAWLGGLAIAGATDGTTLIVAPAIDQAGLHGLLHRVRDAGLRLVSVTRADPGPDSGADPLPPDPAGDRCR